MGDEAVVTAGGTLLSGMLRFVVVVDPYATLLNTAAMLFSRLAPSSDFCCRGSRVCVCVRWGIEEDEEVVEGTRKERENETRDSI